MKEQDKHLPFTQKKRSQSSNKSCLHFHEQQHKANKKRLSIPLMVDETFRFMHEKNISSTCKHATKKSDPRQQFSMLSGDSNGFAYSTKKNQSAILQGLDMSVNNALKNSENVFIVDELNKIKIPLKCQQNNILTTSPKRQQYGKKDKKCCRKDNNKKQIHYQINKQNLKQILQEEFPSHNISSPDFNKIQLPQQIQKYLQNKFLPFFVQKFTELENSCQRKVQNLVKVIIQLQEKNRYWDDTVMHIRNQNQSLKTQIVNLKNIVLNMKEQQTSSISITEQSCCGNLGCFGKGQSSCVHFQDFESVLKDKFQEFFDRKMNLRDNSWQTVLRRQNLQLQNCIQTIKLQQEMNKKKFNKKINDLQMSIIDIKEQLPNKYVNNSQNSRQSLEQTGNIEKIQRMINVYNENFLDLEQRLKKVQSTKK